MACLAEALGDRAGTSRSVKQRSKVSKTQTKRNMLSAHTGACGFSPCLWICIGCSCSAANCHSLWLNATTAHLWPSTGCFWRFHVRNLTEFKKTQASAQAQWSSEGQNCALVPNTPGWGVFFFAKKRGAWGLFCFFCLWVTTEMPNTMPWYLFLPFHATWSLNKEAPGHWKRYYTGQNLCTIINVIHWIKWLNTEHKSSNHLTKGSYTGCRLLMSFSDLKHRWDLSLSGSTSASLQQLASEIVIHICMTKSWT